MDKCGVIIMDSSEWRIGLGDNFMEITRPVYSREKLVKEEQ